MKTEDDRPPAYAIVAGPLTGKLWLLPPAAALFYPLAVKALYESGKLLHRASGPGDAMAWLAIAVSAALVKTHCSCPVGAFDAESQQSIPKHDSPPWPPMNQIRAGGGVGRARNRKDSIPSMCPARPTVVQTLLKEEHHEE